MSDSKGIKPLGSHAAGAAIVYRASEQVVYVISQALWVNGSMRV